MEADLGLTRSKVNEKPEAKESPSKTYFPAATWFQLILLLIPLVTAQEDRKGTKTVDPTYPALARKMNLQGTVKVEITIAPDGSGKFVNVLGGNPVLPQPVEDAFKQWKYVQGPAETKKVLQFKF